MNNENGFRTLCLWDGKIKLCKACVSKAFMIGKIIVFQYSDDGRLVADNNAVAYEIFFLNIAHLKIIDTRWLQ